MSNLIQTRLRSGLNLSKAKFGQLIRRPHSNEAYQAGKHDLPGFLSLGFASGALGAVLGLGGAFVALPVMTGHFKMPQGMAHGTSIAVVLATSLGACYSYAKRIKLDDVDVAINQSTNNATFFGVPEVVGSIHVVNAASLALTSTVMVVFGAMLSKRLPGAYLKLIHGSMMVVCAPLIPFQSLFKGSLDSSPAVENCNTAVVTPQLEISSPKYDLSKVVRPMVIGVVTGTLAGMLGVGGGIIMVPALNFFTDMDFQQSLGTSLAAVVPTALVGTITQLRQGNMYKRAAGPLAVGCLVGSYLGGKYGGDLGDDNLKYTFAVFMSGLGVRTIYQAVKLIRKI